MNSLLYLGVGGALAGAAGVSLATAHPPAQVRTLPSAAVSTPLAVSVDDVGHVYPQAAQVVAPKGYGIVCEYRGAQLVAGHPGRDGARVTCPERPPVHDVVWTTGDQPPAAPDPADPDVPACRSAGGDPAPPQLGGGGGPGAPVDFCMISGHLWGPGGETGAPWITTVVTAVECRLLGGVYHGTADPDLQPQTYNCVRP